MMNNYFFPLRLSSSSFFFFLPSPITFFIILSFSLSLSLSPSLSLHRLLELYHVITSREKSKDRIERVSIRVKQNSGSRATSLSLFLSLVSRFLGFFVCEKDRGEDAAIIVTYRCPGIYEISSPLTSVSVDGLRGFSSRTQIAQMFHEIARKYRWLYRAQKLLLPFPPRSVQSRV